MPRMGNTYINLLIVIFSFSVMGLLFWWKSEHTVLSDKVSANEHSLAIKGNILGDVIINQHDEEGERKYKTQLFVTGALQLCHNYKNLLSEFILENEKVMEVQSAEFLPYNFEEFHSILGDEIYKNLYDILRQQKTLTAQLSHIRMDYMVNQSMQNQYQAKQKYDATKNELHALTNNLCQYLTKINASEIKTATN